MRKGGALISANQVVALYLLQFKRFSRSRSLIENGALKGIPNLSKMITSGLSGRNSEILGWSKNDLVFDEFWSHQESINKVENLLN